MCDNTLNKKCNTDQGEKSINGNHGSINEVSLGLSTTCIFCELIIMLIFQTNFMKQHTNAFLLKV